MAATSVRIPDDVLEGLEALARRVHADRSTILRQAIDRGLKELRLEQAIQEHQGGRLTTWAAARQAGVTLWEFMDVLNFKGRGVRTDEELLWAQIEADG